MKQPRDITSMQFYRALQRHGMREVGYLGYVDLGIPGRTCAVSMLNANSRRLRTILAYLLRQQAEMSKRFSADSNREVDK